MYSWLRSPLGSVTKAKNKKKKEKEGCHLSVWMEIRYDFRSFSSALTCMKLTGKQQPSHLELCLGLWGEMSGFGHI